MKKEEGDLTNNIITYFKYCISYNQDEKAAIRKYFRSQLNQKTLLSILKDNEPLNIHDKVALFGIIRDTISKEDRIILRKELRFELNDYEAKRSNIENYEISIHEQIFHFLQSKSYYSSGEKKLIRDSFLKEIKLKIQMK